MTTKEQMREYTRAYSAAHPDKHRARNRRYYERNHYAINNRTRKRRGLPEATRPQPAGCECCGRSEKDKSLNLDHDHVTGRFRGWLCATCNMALGQLGDDIAGVQRLVNYLNRADLT